MNNQKRTQTIVFIGIMTALIAAVTVMIQIPIPQGYLNLGDVMVMISAVVLPVRGAMLAAGLGSAIVDLFTYPQYAIFTLFIKMAEVLVVVKFAHYLDGKKRYIPFFLAGFTMMFLYGLVDAYLAAQLSIMPVSMAFNSIQAILSSAIATLAYPSIIVLKDHLRGKG